MTDVTGYGYLYALEPGLNINDPFIPYVLVNAGNPIAQNVQVTDNTHTTVSPGDSLTLTVNGISIAGFQVFSEGDIPADIFQPGQGQGVIVTSPDGSPYFLSNTLYVGANDPQTEEVNPNGEPILQPACFFAGTRIRSAGGEKPVETLKSGDLVTTSDHREVTVRWIGRHTVSRLFADPLRFLPIRVKAGALSENVPSRDLLVSPDHALFVDGVLIQAGALVNDTSIVRESNVPMTFTYYHVEVEDHALILAENTPAETFVDNVDRMAFDNWDEYQALYPEGRAIVEMPYPRAKAHRQVPRAIRERLAERAASLETISSAA